MKPSRWPLSLITLCALSFSLQGCLTLITKRSQIERNKQAEAEHYYNFYRDQSFKIAKELDCTFASKYYIEKTSRSLQSKLRQEHYTLIKPNIEEGALTLSSQCVKTEVPTLIASRQYDQITTLFEALEKLPMPEDKRQEVGAMAFEVVSKDYKANNFDASKHPALTYHHHLNLLRVPVLSAPLAKQLKDEHDALLKRLQKLKALPYHVEMTQSDERAKTVFAKHKGIIAKNADFMLVAEHDAPYAKISVKLGAVSRTAGKASETFSQQYVKGTKTVKDESYARNQETLKRKQEQLAWVQKKYNSGKCSRGDIKGKDCFRAEAQRIKSLSKDMEQLQKLMKGGPTKVVKIYDNFTYPVERPWVELSYPVEVTISWPSETNRKPIVLNDTARVRGSATFHQAYPKYGVGLGNTPIPSDERIMEGVHQAAASMIFNAAQKVKDDRSSRPKPANLSPREEADLWLTSYCVQAGLSLAQKRQAELKAMPQEARALIGEGYDCPMDDYYKPLRGERMSKPLPAFKLLSGNK